MFTSSYTTSRCVLCHVCVCVVRPRASCHQLTLGRAMAEIEVDGGGRTLVDERVARHFNHRTRVWHNVIPSRSIDRLIDDATQAYLKVKTTTSNLGIPYETNATYCVSGCTTSDGDRDARAGHISLPYAGLPYG